MALWLGLVVGCDYTETTHEVGHRGRARANPYLAAERLLRAYDWDVSEARRWPQDDDPPGVIALPASLLDTGAAVAALESRVERGTHAIVFVDFGEVFYNDWGSEARWRPDEKPLPEALDEWLRGQGVGVDVASENSGSMDTPRRWRGYEVAMQSLLKLGDTEAPIAVVEIGAGRVTLVADARPFRNRYIGDHDHAELLLQLVRDSPYPGEVRFVRSGGRSFWGLVWAQAAPGILGLLVLIAFWLWKNLPRFGPIETTERERGLRDYEDHLEALGDFHWRLDRGKALLDRLRAAVLERAQRLAAGLGQADADIFEVMATRADLTRARAERAMTQDRPRDAAEFARLVADLQRLHLHLS